MAAYKTVPLELINLNDDGFHLLVEVVVFGQSYQAVLDTGASKTVFDKETIEKALRAAGYGISVADACKYLHDWCDTMQPEYMMVS